MRIGKFLKSPAEVKRYTVEYSNWVDTGEYVSTAEFTITPTTANPLAVQTSYIPPNGTQVQFFVEGGNAGETYTMVVKMTTSNAQVKEDAILFVVQDAA